MKVKRIELFFQEQPSDKVYNVTLVKTKKGYTVEVEWGRRGSRLSTGTKAVDVDLEKAEKAYDKVVRQKMRKGYEERTEDNEPAAVAPPKGEGSASKAGIHMRAKVGDAAQLLNPVDDDDLENQFKDPDVLAQQKLDGKRVIIHLHDESFLATNREGQETSIPDSVGWAAWDAAPAGTVLDGELVSETYWVFDVLAWGDADVRKEQYLARLTVLEEGLYVGGNLELVPSALNEKAKRRLYEKLQKQNAEGIVFKRMDTPYVSGRPSSGGPQLKYKFIKTADVFITENAGNAYSMAVMNDGEPHDVGNIFAGTTSKTRKQLDELLSKGETPVAEVRYLYATKDDQLFQPVFVRLRDDKAPEDCKLSQLVYTDKSGIDAI